MALKPVNSWKKLFFWVFFICTSPIKHLVYLPKLDNDIFKPWIFFLLHCGFEKKTLKSKAASQGTFFVVATHTRTLRDPLITGNRAIASAVSCQITCNSVKYTLRSKSVLNFMSCWKPMSGNFALHETYCVERRGYFTLRSRNLSKIAYPLNCTEKKKDL